MLTGPSDRPLPPPLQVIDGTLCGPETLAICVRGQCVKAGCDHVVDSPRKLDKCGVCGGKGNSCRKVSGSLNPSRWVSPEVLSLAARADRALESQGPKCALWLLLHPRGALSFSFFIKRGILSISEALWRGTRWAERLARGLARRDDGSQGSQRPHG